MKIPFLPFLLMALPSMSNHLAACSPLLVRAEGLTALGSELDGVPSWMTSVLSLVMFTRWE